MSSKHIGADLNLAWPSAEIAVMGAEACNIAQGVFRGFCPEQKRQELVETYLEKFANPYVAASKGYIDGVIFPHETRMRLINGLETCLNNVHRPKRNWEYPL